ncbi:hypothetical protein CGMCC3_g1684 [Colletotrichum fructicola]|nr:uncharacterized protein CGMCC3_g1684 [Colletotrichum fructicola]KAE9582147.1 hypothetical protein CGMCC3_g1684 [Colletotrichum fructicola]
MGHNPPSSNGSFEPMHLQQLPDPCNDATPKTLDRDAHRDNELHTQSHR